jgi:hypothetical protein
LATAQRKVAKLERRAEDEALADGRVGRLGIAPVIGSVFAPQPFGDFRLLHPGRAGQDAGVLVGVAEQPPFVAETGPRAHGVDRVDAGLDAVLVKEDVAGDLDRVDQAHRAAGGEVGIVEKVIVDLIADGQSISVFLVTWPDCSPASATMIL